MCGIIESSQKAAYQAVNTTLVQRNWMIGYRIAEEEFGGEERSEYRLKVIKKLSKELTNLYGKGYDRGTLYRCLRFYRMFPEIVASLRQQSGTILSWTHYRILLQVEAKKARDWYEKEVAEQTWSVRTLQRNIPSQYYYRMHFSFIRPAKTCLLGNMEPVIPGISDLSKPSFSEYRT